MQFPMAPKMEASIFLHYVFSDKIADWNAHEKITCHFRRTQSLYKNFIKLGPSRMTYLLINSKLTGLGLGILHVNFLYLGQILLSGSRPWILSTCRGQGLFKGWTAWIEIVVAAEEFVYSGSTKELSRTGKSSKLQPLGRCAIWFHSQMTDFVAQCI